MLDVQVMQSMATLGYIFGIFGLVACIALYFAVPKLIKFLLNNEDSNEETQ